MSYRKNMPVKTRKFVKERDGHQCTCCGATDELVIHHILPVIEGGSDDAENLTLLCKACHKEVHIERGDEYGFQMSGGKKEEGPAGTRPGYMYLADEDELTRRYNLTPKETSLAIIMFFMTEFPNLSNVARRFGVEELEAATLLASLRDKGLLTITTLPGMPSRYAIKRQALKGLVGREVRYYDANMNVVAKRLEPENTTLPSLLENLMKREGMNVEHGEALRDSFEEACTQLLRNGLYRLTAQASVDSPPHNLA